MIKDREYMQIEDKIKHVAMYVRKSRAEEGEKDLENHMMHLKLRCEANEWTYELYKEVGSGSSIDDRPQMIKLLDDIEKKLYDAVLVVDFDRLTRGTGADNDRIMHSLMISDTLIVVEKPYHVLDPHNESDQDSMLMQGFMANFEYRKINKRMREGKKIAQYKGQWVNSVPPYGYTVDKQSKKLTPDEEESKIVLRIKEMFFENKSTSEIAWILNKEGVRPRKALEWRASRIGDILQNEVYVGTLVYNKSEGNRNKANSKYSQSRPFRNLPESEWKRVYNCHPKLFTDEEFKRIQEYFKNSSYSHKGARTKVYALTGLCKTPDGKTLKVHQGKSNQKKLYLITKANKFGDPTIYKGVSYNLVQEYIKHSIEQLKVMIDSQLDQGVNNLEKDELNKKIVYKQKELDSLNDEKARITQGYLKGIFDDDEMIELKKVKTEEINKVEKELEELQEDVENASLVKVELRKTKVETLLENIKNSKSDRETNEYLKTIIKEIIVDRTTDDEIKLTVNFL